jgi:crossover junction endonuclease EME1
MEIEVIDLISSPNSQSSASPRRPLAEAHGNQARQPSDYSVIDLTDVTADFIPQTQSTSTGCLQTTRTRSSLDRVRDTLFLFSSDDIDAGSLGEETIDVFPARKKPRISDPERHKVTAEPRRITGSRNNEASNTRPGPAVNRILDLDEDPFTSSPPAIIVDRFDTVPVFKASTTNPEPARPCLPFRQSPKRTAVYDPISSSAPQPETNKALVGIRHGLQQSKSDVISIEDSEDGISRSSSDDDLPDIDVLLRMAAARNQSLRTQAKSKQVSSTAARSKKSSDQKTREKMAKEAERAGKKLEKEQAREKRALEKREAAALAEVNKIRTDKKVSTPEMMVDLPSTLDPTVKIQAEAVLKDLDVEYQTYASPVPNVIKWRRKVRARYNVDLGHWEPIDMRIEPETHALVILSAGELVDLALEGSNDADEGDNLAKHVGSMRQHFPGHTLVYLIEGLTSWMRKNRTVRNRQFTSAVRSGLSSDVNLDVNARTTSSSVNSRRPRSAASISQSQQTYISEDLVEDALLSLQVHHRVLIHHTNSTLETAQQLAVFTQHISTIPYRRARSADDPAGFCMEAGQVRAGDGAHDTYVRLLQEISRVTAPVAHGVVAECRTVAALVKELEKGGPLRLENVQRCADRDGALTDRRIGQAVSRRLHKVFLGRDDRSTDV